MTSAEVHQMFAAQTAGIDFEDADDRAIFRQRIREATSSTKTGKIREWMKACGGTAAKNASRDDITRELAFCIMVAIRMDAPR